jgi:hypothetical protein
MNALQDYCNRSTSELVGRGSTYRVPLIVTLACVIFIPARHTLADGLVFWIDNGINDAIYRANLDGTDVVEILSNVNGTHMAVDPHNERVYWSNGQHLRRSEFDGSNANSLLHFSDARSFHGLAFDPADPGALYYALASGTIGEVAQINTDGTGYRVLAGGGKWFDIALDSDDSLLLLSTRFVSGNNPRMFRLPTSGFPLSSNSFPNFGSHSRVAVHSQSDSLFWTGPSGPGGGDSVWRSNLDGSSAEIILGRAEDIQVFGDKLYYAQLANPNRVDLWRANLDGSSPELVVVGSGNMTTFAIIPEPSTLAMLVFGAFLAAHKKRPAMV